MRSTTTLVILILVVSTFGNPVVPSHGGDLNLFKYEEPSRQEQILYVSGVAAHMMRIWQWHRQFDDTKCPEFTKKVCPEGLNCEAPKDPPSGPADVCDLKDAQTSYKGCSENGDCRETGTCPVTLCQVEKDRLTSKARDESGLTRCSFHYCQEEEHKLEEKCRPVTRCDIKEHENHLDECKDPENTCKTHPLLCVNVCDLTGIFSRCGHPMCYIFPYLHHCPKFENPDPCPEGERTPENPTCCIGKECYDGFNRCKWGYSVAVLAMDTLTQREARISSSHDEEGNLIYDCINEADVVYRKDLIYECFKDGILRGGFKAIERKLIEDHINEIKGTEFRAEKEVSEDGHKMTIDLSKTEKEVVDKTTSGPR